MPFRSAGAGAQTPVEPAPADLCGSAQVLVCAALLMLAGMLPGTVEISLAGCTRPGLVIHGDCAVSASVTLRSTSSGYRIFHPCCSRMWRPFPSWCCCPAFTDLDSGHALAPRLPAGWVAAHHIVAAAGIVLGGRCWCPLLGWTAQPAPEIFTAASLLVVAIAARCSWVGPSAALGSLLAGVPLAESEYRREPVPINSRRARLGLFFIAVGMSTTSRRAAVPAVADGRRGGRLPDRKGRHDLCAGQAMKLPSRSPVFTLPSPRARVCVSGVPGCSGHSGVLGDGTAHPGLAWSPFRCCSVRSLLVAIDRLLLPRFANCNATPIAAGAAGRAGDWLWALGAMAVIIGRLDAGLK